MENIPLENEYIYEREKGVPEFFEPGYVERVVDALPYYFPNYLKERLKREHPDIPIVKISEEEEMDKYINYHHIFAPYYYGAYFLDEMLTESLTLTILTGINDYIETDSIYRKNLLEPFLSDYGRNNSTIELIQCMQVAMLSGDFRETNRFLNEKYNMTIFDLLSEFAHKATGEEYVHTHKEKDDSETVGVFNHEKLQIHVHTVTWRLIEVQKRLLKTLERSLKLERMLLSKDINKTKKEIEDLKIKMKMSYANVARIGIHETLHYLSFNPEERRVGFKFLNDYDLYKLSRTY